MKTKVKKSSTRRTVRSNGHRANGRQRKATLVYADVDSYLQKITPKRDKTLTAMEAYAKKNGFPIIGPLVGRILYQLTTIIGAHNVLELGSGYGYSAYWFSLAMGRQGRITMTDTDESNRDRAYEYFKRGKIESKITFILDDALEIASSLRGPYDIILNDIDKHEYPETIDIAARLLRPGGLFITDNIIWSGRVFNTRQKDADTRAIRQFTKLLYEDERFFTTVMPVRDGIAVARLL
jgi:predicted O-methyltransferase YrrM